MHGRYFRCGRLTPLFAKQIKSIFALSHLSHITSKAVLLLDTRIWIPLRNRLLIILCPSVYVAVSLSHDEKKRKMKNIQKVSRKTDEDNLYDRVKAPLTSSVYYYIHLSPLPA